MSERALQQEVLARRRGGMSRATLIAKGRNRDKHVCMSHVTCSESVCQPAAAMTRDSALRAFMGK